MEIIHDIKFTKEDFELLKKELPNDPCKKCDARIRGYCCGCPQGTDYDKYIKPYKDNNVLEIALDIKQYKDTLREIKKHELELSRVKDKLPLEVICKVLPYV